MKIFFYTKENCSLCDEALEKVHMLREEKELEVEIRDIHENEEWLQEYHLRIPVITDADGQVLQEGIVTYGELSQHVY
jgi:hypothetical protein